MEDVYWLYRAALPAARAPRGARLFFHCGGIDYRFQVRIGGKILLEQEGMFTPVNLDLTAHARRGAVLEVLVWPVPKSRPAPADRVQANQSCKPAVAYGWDFHPRLVPLGIWQEARLEWRPASHLTRAEVRYELDDALTAADVRLEAELSAPGTGTVSWTLRAPNGRTVLARRTAADTPALLVCARIEKPVLWWPHDQGTPALYTSTVELRSAQGTLLQRCESRVGFRRTRLVMHPGAWDEPPNRVFPKSRSHPPITLELNGRQIFCKGSNWVTPDIFPGTLTRERYAAQLGLVRGAHMNLLRCWGGANVQKEAFFELCDELGIMVWQEFPLACNRYEGSPAYLRVLDQESRSIIDRLRPHASVVLWCGGNELFNCWSGMTDQDLALRLLNRNCYDLDPQRPFLMTSPLDGMGHGHYIFRSPEGQEVFQLFAGASCTAYTEFGCGGPASAALLRQIIPEAELWPVRAGTAWETHHAVTAWEPNSHLLLDVIERYLGPCRSIEEIAERGQFLQGEGLKCLFEEVRRQKPKAAMALNWCFNEPWPCAANMSIVSWPAEPKAAYAEVRQALRPALASARIPRFTWQAGDLFTPELWLLNDAPRPLPAGRVEAWLELADQEHLLLGWDHAGTAANTNLPGPVVRFLLPAVPGAERLTLRLRVPGQPALDSVYALVYQPPAQATSSAAARPLNQ
jgi:beta-mannosidase